MAVTRSFLRCALQDLPGPRVASRRAYHQAKAKRLHTIRHRLDRLAVTRFENALAPVASRLRVRAGAALRGLPPAWPHARAKVFAFPGIALPA